MAEAKKEQKIRILTALAMPSGAGGKQSAPSPKFYAVDPLADKERAITEARRAAGIKLRTYPLWASDDQIQLQFPLDDSKEALAFVHAAFCHRGWRRIAAFRRCYERTYDYLSHGLKRDSAQVAKDLQQAARQMRCAMDALRPDVAKALLQIEEAAVSALQAKLNATLASAQNQTNALLVLPKLSGKSVDAQTWLECRRTGALSDIRNGTTPLVESNSGALLRDQLAKLAPIAQDFARVNFAKQTQRAFKAIRTVLSKVSPSVEVLITAGVLAEPAIEEVLEETLLSDAISSVVKEHKEALAKWAEYQQRYAVAHRSAAEMFPVLFRFGLDDVIHGAKEDKEALGARIAKVIVSIYSGATSVRKSYVESFAGSAIQPKRPAQNLQKALKGRSPPDDPVGFVIKEAEGTVWKHPQLIQEATRLCSESRVYGGPFSLLDSFVAAVSAQAVAELITQQEEGSLKGIATGVGQTVGLIALHFLAPPLGFVADVSLAAGDLSSGLTEFGDGTALSHCAFDPYEALGEEPSLAWFLASQAFNVLTVG